MRSGSSPNETKTSAVRSGTVEKRMGILKKFQPFYKRRRYEGQAMGLGLGEDARAS